MSSFINTLKQADILYGMTPTQLEMVANLCQERSYNAGEIIFPEGASSNELYIIIQGEVKILVNPVLINNHPEKPSPSSTIAILHSGQSFGEVALVDHGLRSATALASQNNTRLLAIPSAHLLKLCETYLRMREELLSRQKS